MKEKLFMTRVVVVLAALVLSLTVAAPAQTPEPSAPTNPTRPADPAAPAPAAPDEPNEPEGVLVQHKFQVGDQFELEVVKAVARGRSNKSSKAYAKIEILAIDEDAYTTIAWTTSLSQRDQDLIEVARTPSEVNAAMVAKAVDGLRIEFILDDQGEIVELTNMDEARKAVLAAIEAYEKLLIESGQKEEQVKSAVGITRTLVDDDETLPVLLLTDAATYFTAYGYELIPGQPFTTDVDLPNAFGGPDLPGEVRAELDADAATAPKIRLSLLYSIKSDEAKTVIVETVKALMQQLGRPVPKDEEAAMQASTFSTEIVSDYTIDRESGRIEFAKSTTSTRFGDASRRDTVQFRLLTGGRGRGSRPSPSP